MPTATVLISVTEMPQFRRLVDFLEAVQEYADRECFLDLQQLVEDCRSDLLKAPREG